MIEPKIENKTEIVVCIEQISPALAISLNGDLVTSALHLLMGAMSEGLRTAAARKSDAVKSSTAG